MQPFQIVIEPADHALIFCIGNKAHHLLLEHADRHHRIGNTAHHSAIVQTRGDIGVSTGARQPHAEATAGDVHQFQIEHLAALCITYLHRDVRCARA